MAFNQLLAADRIAMLVEPGDRDQVLDAAARLLSDTAPETTVAISQGLRNRERLGSTAIGHGIAIPHGRNTAYREARGGAGGFGGGVLADALDQAGEQAACVAAARVCASAASLAACSPA